MKKTNLLSRAELRKVIGGQEMIDDIDTKCWDECLEGPGDIEGMCTGGLSCIKVPTEGCFEPYVPRKCRHLV
ncbi:hypothetical protein [Pedobacter sp. UC225_65]|uniref:hypothetical protein n=1 Tax=Pedobacter sp. UC225_65 TaxID=3350173 RepID=UPI00366D2E12